MAKSFRPFLILAALISIAFATSAQNGIIRGFVYEKSSGEPVMFANVFLQGTTIGATTDEKGFYTITSVPAGSYTLMATTIGYDTARVTVNVKAEEIANQQLFINLTGVQLEGVNVNAAKTEKVTEVQISTVKATPKDIKRIPSMSGDADLAQFLQVLPGVISTGDQGGQLYIRGGAPVHNKVMLDGMNLYNAFHSIGFFSVYETEVIRNVEVITGGFGAEYGGRISAVIDVNTRDGNKRRFGGQVSVSPFMSRLILEGPIKKLNDEGNSISYILTAKKSYLEQSSKLLYPYAATNEGVNDQVLPYNFTDLFGKVSIVTGNGSKINITAFNFNDNVDYDPLAEIGWTTYGIGTDFTLIPGQSKALIGGYLNYSDYSIEMLQQDAKPRTSTIGGFNLGVNFTYFLENNSEFKYGVDINGFSTTFEFFNYLGLKIDQNQNTTELGGFLKYRKVTERLVFEPSLRVQYYASLNNISPEPRLGMKYNASERLRFKFATGLYSQNLISTKSNRDVVDLFVGFLSGPEERLQKIDGSESSHKLQKAIHVITGAEYDLTDNIEINVEPYIKIFTQFINLNRNKVLPSQSNYMLEEGKAYGLDISAKYESDRWYLWGTYSISKVDRNDGEQVYPPFYDRRHNVNLVGSYLLGEKKLWEVSTRWNLGSGFPFTLTQGYYPQLDFLNGIRSDYLTQNGNLGIIYDEDINAGRLPYYHRLDVSAKRRFVINKNSMLDVTASVTNVYNRDNIFYVDRVTTERVNQLPILPSIAVNLSF